MLNKKSKIMGATNFQHDYSTNAYYHVFPPVPEGISADAVKILTWLKEYDETCQEARAQMIKKIDEFLGITKPLK